MSSQMAHYKKFCSCLAGLEIDAPDGMFRELADRFDSHVGTFGEINEADYRSRWNYSAWRESLNKHYSMDATGEEEVDGEVQKNLITD
jgi:hypothetical protein